MLRNIMDCMEVAQSYNASTDLPLYVSRPVLNRAEVYAWLDSINYPALEAGREDDLHVTIAYSTTLVDWSQLSPQHDVWTLDDDQGARAVETFGDTNVLKFTSVRLSERWDAFRTAGASWDHPTYQPHISVGKGFDSEYWSTVAPYVGDLQLGPERFDLVRD